MSILVPTLLFLGFFLFCISRMYAYQYGRAKIRATRSPEPKRITAPAPTPVKPKEKSVDAIIQDFRNGMKAEERSEENKWKADYFANLPLEEHPDYLVITPKDDKDVTLVRSHNGNVVAEFATYYNKDGYQYSVEPDYITRTAKITHRSLSWTVPIDQVRK